MEECVPFCCVTLIGGSICVKLPTYVVSRVSTVLAFGSSTQNLMWFTPAVMKSAKCADDWPCAFPRARAASEKNDWCGCHATLITCGGTGERERDRQTETERE